MKLCFTDHGTAKIRSDLSKFFPPELRPACSQDIKSAARQLLLKCDQKEYQSLLDVSKLLNITFNGFHFHKTVEVA